VTSKHTQKIGMGNLTVDTNYQNNNYLTAPQSTSLNSRMQYVLPWAGGTSRFSWFRVGNERPGFNSVTQNLSISDQRAWSSWLNTQFDASLARADTNSSFGDTRNERLDIRFTGKTDLRSFTADLLYQRSIPVGETTNFFSATDRTPMLVLKTDARRLFEPGMARVWPFTSELSIGELADPASGGHISRLDFNFGMMRNETKGNSSLRWGGRFKQGIYSDDTAQYVLDYNLGWSYQFDPRSRFELTYRNLRSFGFTPLSIDRTGRNDAFSMNLTYQLNKAFQLIARTGYDVLQADRGNVPWQQVWVQTNWVASPALQVRTSATYDTFNQLWNNLRLDASYDTQGLKFGLGTRYDGRNSVWAATSLYLEGLKIGRTRFATALDWNGYTNTFDAQHYSVIYDLHEAELVIDFMDNNVGFRSGQQIQVFIRLKAFPTRSPFGSGTRGQAIGSGTGWGF
jgi:LPS-assembly protein